MKRARLPFAVVMTCALSMGLVTAQESTPRKDQTGPTITLSLTPAPGGISPNAFYALVSTTDPSGIASIFTSLDGLIAAGATTPSFQFLLETATHPVQVCALATDRAGNASLSCQSFGCVANSECSAGSFCKTGTGNCGGLGGCTAIPGACPTVVLEVCGCDGVTYTNSCFAAQAGVSVAHDGFC